MQHDHTFQISMRLGASSLLLVVAGCSFVLVAHAHPHWGWWWRRKFQNEPEHNKINRMTCAPSEDSVLPSLIKIFVVRFVDSKF